MGGVLLQSLTGRQSRPEGGGGGAAGGGPALQKLPLLNGMLFPPCAWLEPTANPIAHVVASILGGSGGLSKWVNNGDNLSYYMGYRGY